MPGTIQVTLISAGPQWGTGEDVDRAKHGVSG